MAMVEVQCTSCHTRYRIDERVIPDETPTFKCSRCGHVFTAGPIRKEPKAAGRPEPKVEAQERDSFASPRMRQSSPRQSRPLPAHRPAEQAAPAPEQEQEISKRSEPSGEAPEEAASAWRDVAEASADSSKSEAPAADIRAGNAEPGDEPNRTEAPGSDATKAASKDKALSFAPRPGSDPGTHDEPRTGAERKPKESFSFHFGDEPEPDFGSKALFEASANDWKVGDEGIAPPPQPSAPAAGPPPRPDVGEYTNVPVPELARIPDERAFLERSHLRIHSAGFFIGLFFILALAFTAVSLGISSAPAASASLLRRLPVVGPQLQTPPPLETMVSAVNIHTSFETLKDGHLALVVSGQAHNASAVALHIVQVGMGLSDADGHEVSSGAVYCGTTLSEKMVAQMTSHEIEFLQGLDPQKGFVLKPGQSAPFLLVFVDAPKGASRLSVRVSRVAPASPGPAPTAGS